MTISKMAKIEDCKDLVISLEIYFCTHDHQDDKSPRLFGQSSEDTPDNKNIDSGSDSLSVDS